MEEKIEQIIEETVEHDAFGLHNVDKAAAEIAKLVKEEINEIRGGDMNHYGKIMVEDELTIERLTDELGLAQAQLAEMREALWSGEGELEHDEWTEVYDLSTDRLNITFCEYAHLGFEGGQQVKVFVLKLSGKTALQRESKVEMPDEEGSDD